MKRITEINRKNLRTINKEIESKLKEVEQKFGVKIEIDRSRFSKSNYTTTVKVSTIGEDGIVKSKEAIEFERQQAMGVIDEKFEVKGRIRTNSGKVYIIDGYNSRAKKYPIQVHNRDGRYKLPLRTLQYSEVVSY